MYKAGYCVLQMHPSNVPMSQCLEHRNGFECVLSAIGEARHEDESVRDSNYQEGDDGT